MKSQKHRTPAQHHTTLNNTTQRQTAPFKTTQHHTTPKQHHSKPLNTTQRHTAPHSTTQGHKVPLKATLGHRVGLDVSIIVLARPHEASFGLEGLGHHVIDQSMLVVDATAFKLALVLAVVVWEGLLWRLL